MPKLHLVCIQVPALGRMHSSSVSTLALRIHSCWNHGYTEVKWEHDEHKSSYRGRHEPFIGSRFCTTLLNGTCMTGHTTYLPDVGVDSAKLEEIYLQCMSRSGFISVVPNDQSIDVPSFEAVRCTTHQALYCMNGLRHWLRSTLPLHFGSAMPPKPRSNLHSFD